MKTDLFIPALSALHPGAWGLYGPTSFKRYCHEHGFEGNIDTAQSISVDFTDRLHPSLKQADVMVLRLGSAHDGPGTQFALIGTPGRLHDFFIDEASLPPPKEPHWFAPISGADPMVPYHVFPILTETSVVNLAFASGLMGAALGLDEPYPTAAPATGSSTYTFQFQAHTEFPRVLEHLNGQVEVDAVFVGRRAGRPHLFVMEAKSGPPRGLAKHKLVYPVLALAPRVPPEMPIVPVYLRVSETDRTLQYHIVECSIPDPRQGLVCLDQLAPVSHVSIAMTLPLN